MENNNQHSSIKEDILRKIRAHELSMRPRFYFTLKVVTFAAVALFVLLLSVFIFNYIFFSIRINSHAVLLGFGSRGIRAFLSFFPWLPLLLDIVLVIVLQKMLRWFRFGYAIPVLYLVACLLALTVFSGFLLDGGTRINDTFLNWADHDDLPILGALFTGARHELSPDSGFCLCTIERISGNVLLVQRLHSSTTLQVILPPDDLRATTTSLQVGDTVFVAGDRDGDTIRAFGVHKVPPGGEGEHYFFRQVEQ